MGLVPTPEHSWALDSISAICDVAEQYIDLKALTDIARHAPRLKPALTDPDTASNMSGPAALTAKEAPVIGIIKDSAFQFYYPENIEALAEAGAKTIFFSPLETSKIPQVDALYIGGGFPETHARELANNTAFRKELKSLADGGLPIYAECGGLMYLGEKLVLENRSYPMAGVLPIVYGFSKKPQGHGYTIISVDRENPYFNVGSEHRGHEFHYSRVMEWGGSDSDLVFRMQRGSGIINGRDGACYNNVLATYTHLHALGTPAWAKGLVFNAIAYKRARKR